VRVVVDTGLCELHGECVLAAPAVFDIADDDDDHVTVMLPEPPETLRGALEEAVENCPMGALRLES
jgi:ferredoxin